MAKTIFADGNGNIHFGVNAPSADFKKAERKDLEDALSKIESRKLWRCTVCNDICINIEPPKQCPTCYVKDAYVEIELNEFKNLIDLL
jgi:rubrerythrin